MKAKIKFNGGKGALLCNSCDKIIALGTDHDKDKKHYCNKMCELLEPSMWGGVDLIERRNKDGSFDLF